MAVSVDDAIDLAIFSFVIWISFISVCTGLLVLKTLYNVSPLHPLCKYPGPLLWRASRLPASYHHARGDLYKYITAIHSDYGATVRIAPDELSFTSPEAWPQIYNSRPQLQKTQFHFPPQDEEARLPGSMITAPDTEHARLRRLTGPAFLNSSIAEVEPVLQHYTDLLCSQLTEASSEGPQNMVDWLLWTLNDVIGQLALDQEFLCLEKRRMHPWPSFLLSVLKTTATLNQFVRFGFRMKWLAPLIPKDKMADRENFFNTATDAVNQRLAREKEESTNSEAGSKKNASMKRPDIIGLMLREMKGWDRLTDAEITANSVLIVGGGAETTSTCLSATLYHLCKTPQVMARLRSEIRDTFVSPEDITIKAVSNMPYLKATIDESLRIFPVASFITPRVTPPAGHVIDGEVIPGGTYVSMGQWFMGRSERFFHRAKEFRPERWLGPEVKEEGPYGLSTDEVLRPFSLGPRNCIGKLLALAEARLVTAKLLWHFDMKLEGGQDDWVDNARFYILWELQPLMIKFTPANRS
ncbi:hypothetical protein LTR64_005669 [Lithohypha guttulata]|uniref:uncharacterized protein n=1 Tax=Lithohypha guttulata TaxID=1690604 RepID=UPI002DDF7767|nr:hypothetical protein LTR51_002537 [Lithohypha guttulata]